MWMLAFSNDLIIKKRENDEQDVIFSGPLPILQITFSFKLSQQNMFVFYWMVFSKMSCINLFSKVGLVCSLFGIDFCLIILMHVQS